MSQFGWRTLWRRRGSDIASFSVIIIFFIAFFWRVVFNGQFYLAGDPLSYSFPLRSLAWDMLRQGTLPLWTPNILSGYPLLSMAVIAIGYPLTWTYLFLPNYWAEQIFVLAPYICAPAFTYLYAREVGRSPLASLLAGLSFGYGGLMISPIGSNGMPTNSMMWAPLLLIAVERARTRGFVPCLLFATFAYAMSVLTGIGQGFVYVGILVLAYALYIVCFEKSPDGRELKLTDWVRWRPLAVVVSSIILSAGIAAFQIAETLRAAQQSVRHKLTYEHFSEGSFPLYLAVKSIFDPIHNVGDVTTYVPPLVLLLAFAAFAIALVTRHRDRRIFFWFIVAITAFILILGSFTPFYRFVYHIPFVNRFRVPARHTFEWTFALSVMAAYGWDALQAYITRKSAARRDWISAGFFLLCLVLGTVTGFGWWQELKPTEPDLAALLGHLSIDYMKWKIPFTFILFIAVWQGWRIKHPQLRSGLLAIAIMLTCFTEPFISLSRWFDPYVATKDRFSYIAPVTRLVQQFPPEQNRVYTQMHLYAEYHGPRPRIDNLNWAALSGTQEVSGYEPLLLERYSKAMNSSDWNTINRAPFLLQDRSLYEPRSHVLDLLNVTHVISFPNLAAEDPQMVEKDGILLTVNEASFALRDKDATIITSGGVEADTLAMVTTLTNSNHVEDGTVVAKISIYTNDGRVINSELRAGDDTAEWAHERPDVRSVIRHKLAPVFESLPGDAQNSFKSYRYWARIGLGQRVRVQRIEMIKTLPVIDVLIWRSAFYDSTTGQSTNLSTLDAERWETIYQKDGVMVVRNNRALPRAWLVTSAEALDQQEAWAMIRGQGKRSFDPRTKALLELEPSKMPALSGRPLSAECYARIVTYEPNRLIIETNADQQAVLVVSELHYPGWVATLDGVKTPLHQTDYLLRGVVVPQGKHRVEMSYRAPGARNGAIISLFTLLLIGGLVVKQFRGRVSGKRNVGATGSVFSL